MRNLYQILFIILTVCGISSGQVSNNSLIRGLKKVDKSYIDVEEVVVDATYEPKVEIFGSGGIRSSATNDIEENSSLNGSLGASIVGRGNSQFTIGFSVTDINVKTINDISDFGSSMLIPDLSSRSFTLSYANYITNWGFVVESQIANTTWKIDSEDYAASPVSIKAAALYAPFGNLTRNNNFITVNFNAGLSLRTVLGNIGNEQEVRESISGTTQKTFFGLELSANLVINDTKVFINVPFLKGEKSISGLTGGQVVIGAAITGNLLEF